MRRFLATLLAAGMAAVPVLSKAQTTPAPAEPTAPQQQAVPAPLPSLPSEATPSPSQVPAAKPAPSSTPKVTITPYGFVLLQAFFNDGPYQVKDYPGQVLQNGDGGAFIMSARGSRFGFKVALPDDPFTGANLSGVIEADFKGGTTAATGAAWYNSIARIRLAYVTASWGDASGKLSLVAGQDWKIVAPLAPTSIAFGYDQIFTAAGNLNNRDQQIKAIYDMAGSFGLNVSAAMLSPQDAFTGAPNGGADYDAGNRSRKPNFEGRVAVSARDGAKKLAEVGVAGAIGWRRFNNAATPNVTVDTTTHLLAADGVVNVPFVTLQGEAYASDGMEDSYTSLLSSAFVVNSTGAGAAAKATSATNVQSHGYWAQAVLKPAAFVTIPVGYGMAEVRYHGLPNSYLAPTPTTTLRVRNSQFHAGLLFNMTNPWKFGFEYVHTTSGYANNAGPATANQYILASKLDF